MTVRVFTIGSLLTAVLSLAVWLLVVNYLDPGRAGIIGFCLFFLSLFLGLASSAALLGYGIRRLISRAVLPAYTVRTSLRQGCLLGIFATMLLLLELLNLYAWWLAGLALILFVTIELIFLSYDLSLQRRSRHAGT
ncbi:MAG TPA: hypothetical protein VJC05_03530 [Candidatus Andersenbacteria bacterium]|nr:hypothetical protein [Candidatus Andersenbacteria bacterium]